MTRVLTTVHLSDLQKEVLAKVKAAPNPHVAWSDVIAADEDYDGNLAKARDMLGDLGLLDVGDGMIELTDKGEEVMNDENLIDDVGELTDQGKQLAQIDREEFSDQPEAPPNGSEPEGAEGLEGPQPPMESLQLIRSINEDLKYNEQIKSFKKNT